MDLVGFVAWMFCLCYMISHDNGGVMAIKTSKLKDLEIEEKLKLINKPAVEIIKTTYGEEYGCVDFYKQPAFDDPSLKNHTFHYNMRPTCGTSHVEGFGQNQTSNKTFGFLWENGVGCPIGTVPIKRVSKEELIRLNSLTETFDPMGVPNGGSYHFAVARTKGRDKKYNGALMISALYNPRVSKTQFSSSRMHIQIGDDFIQTGWTVNPFLYPDTRTRLFVYSKVGGSGCYNSLCSAGLILVRQDIPLGLVFQPISVSGGTIHYEQFALIKDQGNGNWWLQLYDSGEQVGFWPANRFRQSSGTRVEWGGVAFSVSPPSPPMGNGRFPHFPRGDYKYDSFIARLAVLDGNFKADTTVENTESYLDNNHGYGVREEFRPWPKSGGHAVFYGGPGNI